MYNLGLAALFFYDLLTAGKAVYVGAVLQRLHPFLVLSICSAVITVLFFSLNLISGRKFANGKFLAYKKEILLFNLSAVIGWIGYFTGLKYIEPAIVTSLTACSGPIITSLYFSRFETKTPISNFRGWLFLGIALTMVYFSIESFRGLSALGTLPPAHIVVGISGALLCGVANVLNTLLSKRLYAAGFNARDIIPLRFFLLALLTFVLSPSAQWSLLSEPGNLQSVLFIALVGFALPILLVQIGIKNSNPTTFSVVHAILPIFVLMAQLFDPRLTPSTYTVVGVFVIAGLSLLTLFDQRVLREVNIQLAGVLSVFVLVFSALCYASIEFLPSDRAILSIGFLVVAFLILSSVAISRWVQSTVVQPVGELLNLVSNPGRDRASALLAESPNREMEEFTRRLVRLLDERDDQARRIEAMAREKKQTLADVASQVAHDIRSPLTALSIMSSQIKSLNDGEREIFRNINQRIQDIANNLLNRHRDETAGGDSMGIFLLPVLVESLVSEKRVQYADSNTVKFDLDIGDRPTQMFSLIDDNRFKSILSNLIDNAYQALEGKPGTIRMSVSNFRPGGVELSISDQGPGFSAHILERFGEKGLSGKANGNGLGIHLAKKAIESWGGIFQAENLAEGGAKLVIRLKTAATPDWLAEPLDLRNVATLLVLDDDPGIHKAIEKLVAQAEVKTTVISFTEPRSANAWLANNRHIEFRALVDYELGAATMETGIDTIVNAAIANRAVLVTTRFDDVRILARCQQKAIKIYPKRFLSSLLLQASKL